MDQEVKQRQRAKQETQAQAANAQAAAQAARETIKRKHENPEFLDALRDLGIDTDEYPFLEDLFGPMAAQVHLIANRDESYEKESKWLDQNRVERIIAERSPGRLCRGDVLAVMQGVHDDPNRTVAEPLNSSDKRAVRDAGEAVTNFKTLGIEGEGIGAVANLTTVNKTEQTEETSAAERTSRFFG